MCTPALVRSVTGEFASTPDATIDDALTEAGAYVNSTWGDYLCRATALAAAHILVMRDRSAAAGSGGSATVGAVTSRRAGQWAESYGGSASASADSDPMRAWWQSTIHGQRFLGLRSTLASGYAQGLIQSTPTVL